MVESNPSVEEGEIDLFKLINTLLQSWKFITGVTIIFIVFAYFFVINLTDLFKAETLLVSAREERSGASSSIMQFGGLAAKAGISIPLSSDVHRSLATLESRQFLKRFIKEKNQLPVIFSNYWNESSKSWELKEGQEKLTIDDGVSSLQGAMELETNEFGIISLSIMWKDPSIAAQLANDLVKHLNEQLRQKAITDSKKRMGYLEQELAKTTLLDMRKLLFNLLESEKQKAMLANVNDDFALEVIDPAVAPKDRSKPNRRLIVILVGMSGVLFGVFLVFLLQFVRKMMSFNQKTISSNV